MIEFVLGLVLFAALALSVLVAVALAAKGPRENRIAAAWLASVCVLTAALIGPLIELVARWSI